MKCETGDQNIMKYFDKELNDIEIIKLKQHLKLCKECSNEFEGLSKILGSLEMDEFMEPPEDFEKQVMIKVNNLHETNKKMADTFLIAGYGIISAMLLGASAMLVGYLQDISLLEVVAKLARVFNSLTKIIQALSASQAGTMIYGIMVIAFAIMLCCTGVVIFMGNNTGGAENDAKK